MRVMASNVLSESPLRRQFLTIVTVLSRRSTSALLSEFASDRNVPSPFASSSTTRTMIQNCSVSQEAVRLCDFACQRTVPCGTVLQPQLGLQLSSVCMANQGICSVVFDSALGPGMKPLIEQNYPSAVEVLVGPDGCTLPACLSIFAECWREIFAVCFL